MRTPLGTSPASARNAVLCAIAALLGFGALEACATGDVVFVEAKGDLDAGGPIGPVPGAEGDASTRPTLDGSAVSDAGSVLCTVDGAVPTLALGDGGCVGDLAARAFRFALCVCEEASFNAGFSSATSGAVDAGASASVGVNGNFISAQPANINGSLWTRQGVDTSQSLRVDGELHCAGNLTRSGTATVRSDAWVGGAINLSQGRLEVSGTLTQPANVINNTPSLVTGARRTAAVPATTPCDCQPSQLLPITSLVQGVAGANDNAVTGFSSQAFSSVSSATTRALPCGKLYLAQVSTTAPLTLQVGAQTVLAIAGDLDLGAAFTVELTSPTASLDLLVGGTIRSNDSVRIGSAARPAAVRIYVGGATSLDTSANWEVHGNLYAPTAVLNTSGGAIMDGAVFVRSLAASAPVSVGYDKRVLAVPDNCAPPRGCNDCRDCRGQACVGGQCGACTDSSQCCAPLVCAAGQCVPEAPPR
jgi:hypothetical protein